jgi:ribulose-5-phosphate 4-epimerase/fuculose-1-phosphate aldolase
MSANAAVINSSSAVRQRVSAEEWETRVQLAACYRLAAHYGWTDLIYTHISAVVPGSDNRHFLLNPFGWMFDEVDASNLVKVDLDGNIVDPSPHKIHKAGFVIHSAIHEARPDAKCVFHSHTRAGMALSMLKCGLLPLSQHANLFYGKVAYHESEGLSLEMGERESLAHDLGDKGVMILRNHGTLVCGATIPEAFSMMSHLEKAMQAQMDALATGQELTTPSDQACAATARMGFTNEPVLQYADGASPLGRLEWPALMRMLDRVDPSYRN